MAALAKLLPAKAFGLNWDTLNGGTREVAFPDGYNLLPKERIGNVHIKGRAVLDGPQKLDWLAIFRRMAKDGYTGQFGLETHIDIRGPGQIPASHQSMEAIIKVLDQLRQA
jgi:sugar phosphate isomerase/epimerase